MNSAKKGTMPQINPMANFVGSKNGGNSVVKKGRTSDPNSVKPDAGKKKT